MATVWIFFGAGMPMAGIAAAAATGIGGGAPAIGATVAGAGAAGGAGTLPAWPEFGSGKIGMVETTRGAGFTGAGILTGCSSRETIFSPEFELLALC